MNDSSLDQLLKGKAQTFRDTVRALVQRYGIDENDPTFILLVGTSTLEVILEKYPQEIEALFGQMLSRLDDRWGALQSEWAIAAEKGLIATQMLTQAMENVKQVSEAEQENIKQQAGSQAGMISTVFQEQTEQLKAQAEQLAAHAIASARAAAAEQVKEANKGVRLKHYVEACAIACACAAALILTAWTTAWISRGRAEDSSTWGDIERWNQQQLQACIDAKTPTCNVHIEMPKQKQSESLIKLIVL